MKTFKFTLVFWPKWILLMIYETFSAINILFYLFLLLSLPVIYLLFPRLHFFLQKYKKFFFLYITISTIYLSFRAMRRRSVWKNNHTNWFVVYNSVFLVGSSAIFWAAPKNKVGSSKIFFLAKFRYFSRKSP